MLISQIIKIAFLCITVGSLSIALGFKINSSPWVVYTGNVLGSLVSAWIIIFIGDRITSQSFRNRLRKRILGRKIVTVYEAGEDNKKIRHARIFINKHGIKFFAFLSPLFPGTTIATVAVYALNLDTKLFKKWICLGIFFVCFIYVFGFWWFFVK